MKGDVSCRASGFILLLLATVLMASGSLRDLISPMGYWAAWLVWAASAFWLAYRGGRMRATLSGLPRWIMASYALLSLGMMGAALANQDGASAYQALKVLVIAGLFVAMWCLVAWLNWRSLALVLGWTVLLVLLSIAVSRVWNPIGHPLISGPRQGSFLAVYGVLWKAGALFLPVFLADFLVRPGARAWVLDGLMIAACIFLVLIDGSRTGLLLLVGIGAGFLGFVIWRGDWALVWRRLRYLWLLPVLLVVLQLVNLGVTGRLNATPSAGGVTAGWRYQVAELQHAVQDAWTRVTQTRIGSGDPARIKLLREGVPHAMECQPLGCGFRTTGADVGTGELMATHNAYIAALGDFGLLGFAGMLGFLVAAWLPIWRVLRHDEGTERSYFVVATAGSALAYGMSLMLNTFTTEMSEWGYLILMLAFAWAPPRAA